MGIYSKTYIEYINKQKLNCRYFKCNVGGVRVMLKRFKSFNFYSENDGHVRPYSHCTGSFSRYFHYISHRGSASIECLRICIEFKVTKY